MDDDTLLWQAKLLARLHDPAEKALVLLRDPAGHEGGTSHALQRLLGLEPIETDTLAAEDGDHLASLLFAQGVPRALYEQVRRADWWASAADRPQWPLQEVSLPGRNGEIRTRKVADGVQVRWSRQPVLIHPLSGSQYDLGQQGGLADTDFHAIKDKSLAHFSSLIMRADSGLPDWRRTLLAFWRFGPDLREEEDAGKLGALWRLLPADTRVPDHSIWDHLDLVSAFTGAFTADPDHEAALLALAIGPVQGFIQAARSTSDLWAGSHLLARLSWEAMRVICERLGPDAILFPRLRGVPQVDLWLRDSCTLDAQWFEQCDWTHGATDSNPLFSAALPNRFVAVVPRAQAATLAHEIETRVRDWLAGTGQKTLARLLEAAGESSRESCCHEQMHRQLAGFPEVHWAAVPFSLIRPRNAQRQSDLDTTQLSAAMAPFFGARDGENCGFLASPAWQVLQRETRWDDHTNFFTPNPGVLYPAIHDLAERVLAAAKASRPFAQIDEQGWRCSLTGEAEWLTLAREQLAISYRQQNDTLWTRIAATRPTWARKGEHLSALPAIKRLWPTLFAEEVGQALHGAPRRFVISTHTMALTPQLDDWLAHDAPIEPGWNWQQDLDHYHPEQVALPRRLIRRHQHNPQALKRARQLAGLLECARDLDDTQARGRLERHIRNSLALGTPDSTGFQLESYYALLLLDGDRMGAWLSGEASGPRGPLTYRDCFHPSIRRHFDARAQNNPRLDEYARQARAISPGRHMAISSALNDFSLTLVRHVIEHEYRGRVIYAGGDDVLAMLPVSDLLPAMQRLRNAYSGSAQEDASGEDTELQLGRGFARLGNRLMRLMGEHATASCGAVIVHHQAPLNAVLRELRAAEQRAKTGGGRDAFSLSLLKRAGGIRRFTAHWGEPLAVLCALRGFLGTAGVSRRAVYNTLAWLQDLPQPQGDGAMLEHLLAMQLARQSESKALRDHLDVSGLAHRLTTLALQQEPGHERLEWLENLLSVGEFVARASRYSEGTNA